MTQTHQTRLDRAAEQVDEMRQVVENLNTRRKRLLGVEDSPLMSSVTLVDELLRIIEQEPLNSANAEVRAVNHSYTMAKTGCDLAAKVAELAETATDTANGESADLNKELDTLFASIDELHVTVMTNFLLAWATANK